MCMVRSPDSWPSRRKHCTSELSAVLSDLHLAWSWPTSVWPEHCLVCGSACGFRPTCHMYIVHSEKTDPHPHLETHLWSMVLLCVPRVSLFWMDYSIKSCFLLGELLCSAYYKVVQHLLHSHNSALDIFVDLCCRGTICTCWMFGLPPCPSIGSHTQHNIPFSSSPTLSSMALYIAGWYSLLTWNHSMSCFFLQWIQDVHVCCFSPGGISFCTSVNKSDFLLN